MSRSTRDARDGKGLSSGERRSRGRSLVQRARSFKENFLKFISRMRSPRSSGGLPQSPSAPTIRNQTSDTGDFVEEVSLSRELEYNVRQARFALSHFRSVIKKRQLEMIPGNGTVVLETVTAIQSLLNNHVLTDCGAPLVTASNQVHDSVAKLLKCCDDYLLIGGEVLLRYNILEIISEVGTKIENWIVLIKEELDIQDKSGSESELSALRAPRKPKTLPRRGNRRFRHGPLPDIPDSSSDREMPENTTVVVIERPPESSEDVPDDSPPPKPPLPERLNLSKTIPPPLPPKKRQMKSAVKSAVKSATKSTQCRLSGRSKSPEDSAFLFTTSAGSLDSVLHQRRVDEYKMRVLTETRDQGNQVDEGLAAGFSHHRDDNQPTFYLDESGAVSTEKMGIIPSAGLSDVVDSPAPGPDNFMDRLSGSQAESGFGSIPSRRSSSQSYSASSQQLSSTRSSQQSYSSQESYQTEKRVLSPDASSSSQVPSVVSESDPTVLSTTSSFEKLYVRKPIYGRKTAEFWLREFSSSATSKQSTVQGEMEASHFRSLSPISHAPRVPHSDYVCMSGASVNRSAEGGTTLALPQKTSTTSFRRKRPSPQFEMERKTVQAEDGTETTFIFSHIHTEDGGGIMIEKQEVKKSQTVDMEDSSAACAAVLDARDDSTTEGDISWCTMDQAVQTEEYELSPENSTSDEATPPPLPPKKRPINAYMEMFGNISHSSSDEFLRHSVYAYKMLQKEWQEQQRLLSASKSCCFNFPTDSNPSTPIRKLLAKSSLSLPPALPPKKGKGQQTSSESALAASSSASAEWKGSISKEKEVTEHSLTMLNREPVTAKATSYPENPLGEDEGKKPRKVFLDKEVPFIESIDVVPHIQFKKVVKGVYVVKGGSVDALIAHAANCHETDYMYEEAFIITYRTFITPLELFQKLVNRFEKLCASQYEDEQKASRDTFDFIVRTADSLTLLDLDHDLLKTLMNLVHKVVTMGDLAMGSSLRNIIIQRCELKKLYNNMKSVVTPRSPSARASLFDFKSEQIAEQMTMMDAELFLRIESPEILTWAEDQREELSPNLSRFTVHFNKMSYWTRSRILEQKDSRSRERYLLKFFKIMKHLRKINNFNSCLALLSALDSAPVRRLDWQKHIMEGIQEHSDLIDSSSSFRAYRLALTDSQPPCIPYIGLVLQDLTFINAGNPNLLPDGSINFSKRWQQYDVIQNMARFKIELYNYRKNDKIIKFFNDFDDALSEEEMWQLSEKLKPRPSKNK